MSHRSDIVREQDVEAEQMKRAEHALDAPDITECPNCMERKIGCRLPQCPRPLDQELRNVQIRYLDLCDALGVENQNLGRQGHGDAMQEIERLKRLDWAMKEIGKTITAK